AEDSTGSLLEVVKALIKAGSSLITRERDQAHALHQAYANRDVKIHRFLRKEVAVDSNTQQSEGKTSHHYVAADLNYNWYAFTAEGREPKRRTQEIVNLLIDRGLNIYSNNNGKTPTDSGFYLVVFENWVLKGVQGIWVLYP
ncbi:hypothetical protein CORC01_09539, partial [Colletotrichum orchidophilum]